MDKIEVQYMNIEQLIPYENNPRINDNAVEKVAKSIDEFGFRVPIVVDENNVIITGHTRLKASKLLKLKEVPVIVADNLTEEKIKAFRIADNKVSEASDWDMELLEKELIGLEDMFTGFDDEEFDNLMNGEEKENPYTDKSIAPQYEIQNKEVPLELLVDTAKSEVFEDEIEESDLTRKEKDFLLLAAKRHYTFDYSNIAEYYANATEEMQKLMERSALVIIDYDDAIMNGYAELNASMNETMKEDENVFEG